MKNIILKALRKASGQKEINLEFPENENFGDYSTNIALKNKKPREYAAKLIEKLQKDKELGKIVEKIEVAGGGFINFWLKKSILVDELEEIVTKKEKYGASKEGIGKTIVIDYSAPNIAKRFGIGHLRSTIIGQALYNLYQLLGYKVIGDNHLGDWGTQFGKLIYMIDKEKPQKLTVDGLEELYVKFHKEAEKEPNMEEGARKWFKKLEDGDKEAKEIWKKCIEISLKEFNEVYDLLDVKIDYAYGESFYQEIMPQVIKEAIDKKLTEKSQGALIIQVSGVKTPLMLSKNDEASTYATRDLATIKFRMKSWKPSIIIYEVGAEQELHFKQVFAAAKMLGYVNDSVELIHTKHGMYLGSNGKKFRTREGGAVKLEEVLDEAIKKAGELGCKKESTAKKVGIGAVKYFDLMHSVQSNIVFDWEKVMNLEGNSGPYLQYTFTRCQSVMKKALGIRQQALDNELVPSAQSLLPNHEELLVMRALVKFPEIIGMSAKSYAPNILCNYLFDLAQKYNTFYDKHRIIGSDNLILRLRLTTAVGQVLKNGLVILGIQTPERM